MTDLTELSGSGGKDGSSKKVFVLLLKETSAIMLLSFLLILLLNANIILRLLNHEAPNPRIKIQHAVDDRMRRKRQSLW